MIRRQQLDLFIYIFFGINALAVSGLTWAFFVAEKPVDWFVLGIAIVGIEFVFFCFGSAILGILLIKKHLSDVHRIVNPQYAEHMSDKNPEFMIELHYLLTYTFSSSIKAYNKRCCKEYNFDDLNLNLRRPLKVFFIFFCFGVLFFSMVAIVGQIMD